MDGFRDMAIQNNTRRLTAAILDFVQADVGQFDLPTPKPYPRTQYSVGIPKKITGRVNSARLKS